MASNKELKFNVWEFPVNSGIKIRERQNNTKQDGPVTLSYRVSIPTRLSGKKSIELRQFKTKAEAQKWAGQEYDNYKNFGKRVRDLSTSQRIDAAGALDLLENEPYSLREAVSVFLELTRKVEAFGLDVRTVVGKGLSVLRPDGGEKTLSEVIAELLELKKSYNLSERSISDFSKRIKRAEKILGKKLISEISIDEIKSWIMSLDIGPRSKKNYLFVLKEVFKYAKQKAYLVKNPMDSLTAYDAKSIYGVEGDDIKEPGILTIKEAKRLLKTAQENPDLGLYAAVVLGLFCGIRTEELKKLRWEDVRLDGEQPFVVVSAKIAKKRRIRNVDIPKNAVTRLKKVSKFSGELTRNSYVTDYQKRFRKLLILSKFGFWEEFEGKQKWKSTWKENAMRHSFGSYHYALFGDSMLTSRMMGHKEGDNVLFEHYRALVSNKDAEQYFAL